MVLFFISSYTNAQQVISLKKAKEMVLNNNRELQQADKYIEAAEAAETAAKVASLPTVDASVFGLYLGEPMNTMLPETSVNGSVALTEVIYSGGKINNGKKLAQSALKLQTSQQSLTKSEVLLNTETAYWQLVQTYEQVKLAKKYLSLLDTLHTDLTNKYDVGIIYRNDVLRVSVEMNDAKMALQEATDGLEIAKYSFAQLIGLDTIDFVLEDEIADLSTTAQLLEDPELFVSKRPEVSILEESVKMEELQTALLKGDRKPSLAVSVNGLYSAGKAIDFSNGDNQFISSVGMVTLSVPIFDWGGRKQKVKEQEATAEVQALELENTKELIAIEIRNANLELNRAVRKVALSEESLDQARENLRLLNDQFEAGTITGKDVLEGQVLWQEAYNKVVEAKTALKISEASYHKAIADY